MPVVKQYRLDDSYYVANLSIVHLLDHKHNGMPAAFKSGEVCALLNGVTLEPNQVTAQAAVTVAALRLRLDSYHYAA